MRPADLVAAIRRGKEQGFHDHMVIVLKNRKQRGQRIRVCPGVMGRIVGSSTDGLLVDVSTSALGLAMLRSMEQWEAAAVRDMEVGLFDAANEKLEDFVTLRDELAKLLSPTKRSRRKRS